jgi:hypothetical protein
MVFPALTPFPTQNALIVVQRDQRLALEIPLDGSHVDLFHLLCEALTLLLLLPRCGRRRLYHTADCTSTQYARRSRMPLLLRLLRLFLTKVGGIIRVRIRRLASLRSILDIPYGNHNGRKTGGRLISLQKSTDVRPPPGAWANSQENFSSRADGKERA